MPPMSDPTTARAPEVEERVPLPELIAALSRPGAFPQEGPVEVIQTHVSAVFLVGDRAYKIKKPLNLWGFLDYGTVAMRRHWCEMEIALNRRLASDLYIGVEPIRRRPDGSLGVGDEGEVVEHAVVSVRWDPGATFLGRLHAGRLDEEDLAAAARVLADFHRRYPLAPDEAAQAGPSGIGRVVRQNFLATRRDVGALFPERVHEALAKRIADRLRAARATIRRRVGEGRMVDGHGDVRLEHVLKRDDTIEIVDCVEFSTMIRHLDPLNDMAFLSMDLRDQGRPDLARAFEGYYLDAAGEDPATATLLLPLYRSYRAHVRAKVDAQTWHSPEVPEDVRAAKALGARRYMALAWTYGRAGEVPPLVVLRGPSGSGKSVLATRLAPLLDADVIRSDVARKALAGLAPTDRPTGDAVETLYGPEMSARTYAEVLRRGIEAVRGGRGAILDATYLRRDAREAVRRAAGEAGAPFAILDVGCDDAEIRRRLRRRAEEDADASDADVGVYEAQVKEAEPLAAHERAHAVSFASGEPVERCLMPLLERLETAP